MVDFRAQIVVVKKYLALLAAQTRVDPLLRQSRPRRAQCGGREDLALDLGGARARHCLRWRQPHHRRHPVHGVPVVGRSAGQAAPRRPAARCVRQPAAALDLGASCAAGEFTDELGRQALLRRRRAGAMDHAVPAVDGDLGPCAPVALHQGRLVVRPAGPDLGLQRRPATRPAADLHRARPRREQGVLAGGGRGAVDRSQRAAEAAGHSGRGRRRTGLHPWIGLPIRAWRDLKRRQVDHALEHLADHRQMGAVRRHIAA